MVAPALPYGSCGEHAGFAGTLSIGQDALAAACSSSSPGRGRGPMLFVCAHGGNAEPLADAVRKLRVEGHEVRAWSPAFGGDAHAGRVETSLMLALAPELVGAARPAGNVAPLGSLMPACARAASARSRANGVLGDAAGASAEEGHALLAARSPTSSRSSTRGGLSPQPDKPATCPA